LFRSREKYTNYSIKIDGDEIYQAVGNGEDSRFNYKTKEAVHWYNLEIIKNINALKNKPNKKVLILGVAIGSIIIHLLNKDPNMHITGVDISDDNFDLVRKYSDQSRLTLIKDDANKYIYNTNEMYDVIVCDIFIIDQVPDFVLTEKFMKQINKLLLPRGKFILNSLYRNIESIKKLLYTSFDNCNVNIENKYPIINDLFFVDKN